MNAVFQSIGNIPAFNIFATQERVLNRSQPNQPTINALNNIIADIQINNNVAITPTYFLNNLHPLFNLILGDQHDANEFLEAILNQISLEKHNEQVRILPNNINNGNEKKTTITQNLNGILTNKTTCDTCMYHYSTPANFISLDILTDKRSIRENIRDLRNPELLSERFGNAYFCNHCAKHTEATRVPFIQQWPEVLIIKLMRFSFNKRSNRANRVNKVIEFDSTLEISNNINYVLYAVTCHKGTSDRGHYISYKRHKNNNWLFCDDHNISLVSFSNVQNRASTQGYLFFYQKTSNVQIWKMKEKWSTKFSIAQRKKHQNRIKQNNNKNRFNMDQYPTFPPNKRRKLNNGSHLPTLTEYYNKKRRRKTTKNNRKRKYTTNQKNKNNYNYNFCQNSSIDTQNSQISIKTKKKKRIHKRNRNGNRIRNILSQPKFNLSYNTQSSEILNKNNKKQATNYKKWTDNVKCTKKCLGCERSTKVCMVTVSMSRIVIFICSS